MIAPVKRHINPNFKLLVKIYKHNLSHNFKNSWHAILEGGSRSGKTISSVDFIIYYCLQNAYKRKQIFVIRETYASHKTTLYSDFSNRLTAMGLPNPFIDAKEVSQFDIAGNTIFFMGADKESRFMGAGCHVAYFNEMIDLEQNIFDQTEQRVKEFWIGDYNPKASVHWIYDKVVKRNDVYTLHTTWKDNPHIADNERKKLLSYEPTENNIKQGTADDYLHAVYNLGLRMAPEGQIFKHVNWIDKFPEDVEFYHYGLDFGYTNDPAALVKYAETKTGIYLQGLFYAPLDSADKYDSMLQQKIGDANRDKIIGCDGADPDMVREIFSKGWRTIAVKKPKGSIKFGIGLLKSKPLYIVKDKNFIREQENYQYRVIQGFRMEEPVDKYNHYWDAARYAAFINGMDNDDLVL